MVGPKMQDFCPRINMLKRKYFSKQSYNELWFVKKCQNCTFKVNFLCQKLTEFFQKKSFKNINLGDHFLGKTFFVDQIFDELTFLVGIF